MDNTITLTPEMLYVVPIIAFIVKSIKEIIEPYVWYDKAKRFLPLVSLATGILMAYLFQLDNYVVSGIVTGIAAIAGYETFKAKDVENGKDTKTNP